MDREEYKEKRSRSGFDRSSDWSHWVPLFWLFLECVRGSACSHNNRLIEVIIWQPRIALNEERIEVVVYPQRQVRCGVLLCGADVFLPLRLINYSNSHACWSLWVNTEHTAKVIICKSWCSIFMVCASAHWTTRNPGLIRSQWRFIQSSAKDIFLIYLSLLVLKKSQILAR